MNDHGVPFWAQDGDGCDACGEWTRRRCGCGLPLCTDCREYPHRFGGGSSTEKTG